MSFCVGKSSVIGEEDKAPLAVALTLGQRH